MPDAHAQRLRSGEDQEYYRAQRYAWSDPECGPDHEERATSSSTTRSQADGEPGPANLRACRAGISRAQRRRARAARTIPDADPRGRLAAPCRALARCRQGAARAPERAAPTRTPGSCRRCPRPETADADRRGQFTVVAYSGEAVQRAGSHGRASGTRLRLGLEDGQVQAFGLTGRRSQYLDSRRQSLDPRPDRRGRARMGAETVSCLRGCASASATTAHRSERRHPSPASSATSSIGALICRRVEARPDGALAGRCTGSPMEISLVPVPADRQGDSAVAFHAGWRRAATPKEVRHARQTDSCGSTDGGPRTTVDMAVVLRAGAAAERGENPQGGQALPAWTQESFAEALCQRAASLDEARAAIFEALAARYERTPTRSQVAQDHPRRGGQARRGHDRTR